MPTDPASAAPDLADLLEDGVLLFDRDGRLLRANATAASIRSNPAAVEALGSLAREALAARAGTKRCNVTLVEGTRVADLRPLPGARVVVTLRAPEAEPHVDLVRDEKLASSALVAAGVAQELDGPSAFVTHNLRSLGDSMNILSGILSDPRSTAPLPVVLDEFLGEARTMLDECTVGMDRIYTTLRALGSFMHPQEDETAQTPPNVVVDSTLRMLRHELGHRARVERSLEATLPVRCSAARLGQVLLGLLANAAQALEAPTASGNVVKVRTFDDRKSVVIEVSDNGPGIAPEVLPRIFDERFTTKPRGQGTGLGLTIAREIVRAAGGELTAESTPGAGALFRVRLPAVRVGKPTPMPFKAVTTAPPRRARVLIVDDETLLLRACRRMMAKALDVETAEGAEKAIEVLEKDTRFDAVLCDLMMPHVDGMDLYRMVLPRWPQIASRFVFVTGGVYTTAARQFLDETARPWLEKPVELVQVLGVIERLSD